MLTLIIPLLIIGTAAVVNTYRNHGADRAWKILARWAVAVALVALLRAMVWTWLFNLAATAFIVLFVIGWLSLLVKKSRAEGGEAK